MTDVAAFMKKFGVAKDEIWPVPGGKAHAIKHSALERIAAEQGITYAAPQIVEANGEAKIYSLIVTGKLGERVEWATGEATPHNNKNQYPLAMAEKRAKDRVILKLLAAHGVIYSEEEAEDFKEKQKSSYSIKKERPKDWENACAMLRACQSEQELRETATDESFQRMTADWPPQWLELLREEEYKPMLAALRGNEVVWAG